MQAIAFNGLVKTMVAALAACLLTIPAAEARARHHGGAHHAHATHGHRYAAAGAHVIQCVAFAKQASDVALSGNAVNWWSNAAGVYARGVAPEEGSVLAFRANGRMPLGHVAVVSAVRDSRTIEIDQSHWNQRGISRNVSVVDVSENNDWSAVRVELGHNGTYGSIYPTFGFIYPRPDTTGRIITARSDVIVPRLGAAPSDLRGATEVAEVPVAAHGLDMSVSAVSDDAPNRSLR
ncbi:CHAP domain-containing protein [Rhizosaccharibacter radicis]|uniref:CHAP domain-containing protein n=1 Tax=Rhizosaccharibacter radicis TaxID=2782605 RepID=A0ABT1VZI7_9PROT|nr:CHAP domain-containing protein [Acetobacteraceae bacterium KSS12]